MTNITIPGGLLIAIEGIDGAGKTTLAQHLQAVLDAAGLTVERSKEPTNGQWGTQLRASAASGRLSVAQEVELLLKDRREHVDTLIAPALASGQVVILDRYFPSMVAYQGSAGGDVDELLVQNDFAPRPDLLLLLDLSPEQGIGRIRARGDAPNHFETADNLARCRAIFQALALPHKQVIDASQNAASVARDALAAISMAIARKLAGTPLDAAQQQRLADLGQ